MRLLVEDLKTERAVERSANVSCLCMTTSIMARKLPGGLKIKTFDKLFKKVLKILGLCASTHIFLVLPPFFWKEKVLPMVH